MNRKKKARREWQKNGDAEKAVLLSKHVNEILSNISNDIDLEIYNYLQSSEENAAPINSTTPKELWKEMIKLKMKKSTGAYNVTPKMFKELTVQ